MLLTHPFLFVLLAVPSLAHVFLNFKNLTANEQSIGRKCSVNGGEIGFDNLKSTSSYLRTRLMDEFPLVSTISDESKSFLKKAMLKYCGTRRRYRKAIKKVLLALRACLNHDEKPTVRLLNDIIEKVNDFVCYKDGARATMFIEEDGFDCFSSKIERILTCASNLIEIEPQLAVKEGDYSSASKCIVGALDECDDVTAANMVHALMKVVGNYTNRSG